MFGCPVACDPQCVARFSVRGRGWARGFERFINEFPGSVVLQRVHPACVFLPSVLLSIGKRWQQNLWLSGVVCLAT
eukprot:8402242-Lingulodinium_polyedra.AAC.1